MWSSSASLQFQLQAVAWTRREQTLFCYVSDDYSQPHGQETTLSFSSLSCNYHSLILAYCPLKVQWIWCLLSLKFCSARLNCRMWTAFSFHWCRAFIKPLCLPRGTEGLWKVQEPNICTQYVCLCAHEVMTQIHSVFSVKQINHIWSKYSHP